LGIVNIATRDYALVANHLAEMGAMLETYYQRVRAEVEQVRTDAEQAGRNKAVRAVETE